MNFGLDDDERAMQAAVRELVERRLPLDRIRQAELTGVDRELWTLIADAGVFALGDGGTGTTAAVVVFEELGRALVPGPLVGTYLASGLFDAAASGTRLVGVVERHRCRTISHLADLDDVAVLDDDGIWLVPAREISGRPAASPLDPLTPVCTVADLPRGERIAGQDEVTAWRLAGATLTAALLTGIAGEVIDRAAAYARDRQQFGRSVASFQSIKHLLADMVVRAELARAATYAAAAVVDDPGTGDISAATSGAKVLAGQAAFRNSKSYVQVMGGMGFTWEMPPHLYLKRALVLESEFGNSGAHEAVISASL
jgi:alkylation response protein AidB-like acyl-CoA dehydrogenase